MKLFSHLKLPKIKLKSGAIVSFWLLMLISLVAFVDKKQSQRVCDIVTVNIDDEYNNHFLEEEDVKNLMSKSETENIVGESHQFINLKSLERRVMTHGFVRKVTVSKNLKGNIAVDVTQHRPIARLALPNGNDRYISAEGKILPTSPRFTARVIVLDGPYNNVLAQKEWTKDTLRTPYFNFLHAILKDDFLKVMVSSGHIKRNGEIDIYPQIGKQVIEFGKPDQIALKCKMLEAFYQKIIPAKGWNRYQRVCLKYDNQIVCE